MIEVEARESLVDRNTSIKYKFFELSCRGSREPCGSKFPTSPVSGVLYGVEARESLVD